MATATEITGYVVGDNLEIRRAVTTPPDSIVTAWLTIKRHHGIADEDATLQKEITETDAPGTGQIVAVGGPTENADLRFDLTPDETRALGTRQYIFDIQVQLDDDTIYTPDFGTIQLTDDVTLGPVTE